MKILLGIKKLEDNCMCFYYHCYACFKYSHSTKKYQSFT